MSDFYKRFLVEDVPKATPGSSKQVFLAAFGKHPGWDDHVEDLGLETESLITTKMLLYVKGIGGEIDAGAWEKLDASQLLPAFKHVFIWQRGSQIIVGRMWASSDGKGRTRYPMVVCAHCVGVPLPWALEQVLPKLEQIETACVVTTAAGDVRNVLNQARAELRNAAGASPDTSTVPNGPLLRDRFINSPQFGENHEGLLRILYQMGGQFAPFAAGKFNPRADLSRLRPQHIRAPWGTETAGQAVLLWSQLLQGQVDPAVPVLIKVPLQDPWLDITVGEPTREEMFCLRATPKAVPLASEVPYNLDESFRQAAKNILEAYVEGKKPAPAKKAETSTKAVTAAGAESAGGGMGKIWKWFGGAGVVLIAAIVAFQLVPKSDRKETTSAAGGTPAKSPVPSAGANASQPVQAAPAVIAARPADPPAAKEPEKTTATAPVQTAVAVLPAKLAADARGDAEAVARKEAERKKAEEELARLKRETEEKRLAEEKSKAELAAKAEAAKMAALAAEKEKALAAAAQQLREAAILTKPASTEPAVRTEAASASTGLPAGSFTNSLSMIFVRLPMGYWAGRTEVTEAQFKQVMGPEVRVAAVGAEHPVHEVSWNEATEFCQKLSESERKSGWLQKGWAYGLPTEAQWAEFVGDAKLEDSVTSYKLPKQRTRPEPVGSTQRANQFGLFDVRGNVWEWCFSTNSQKTARGGAYNGVTDRTVGLDATWSLGPEGRRQDIGFRCVMVPER